MLNARFGAFRVAASQACGTATIKVVRVLGYAKEYLCMHIDAVSNRKGKPISRSEGKKKCANAQNVCLVRSRADLKGAVPQPSCRLND